MGFGTQQPADTITYVSKSVLGQQFYKIKSTDYVPYTVGEGEWSSSLLFSNIVDFATDFELGIVGIGASALNLEEVDINTSSIQTQVVTWAKKTLWTIPQVKHAIATRNLDFIEDKVKALKRHWDLGIQKSCFLGLREQKNFPGLLNHPDVVKDTTTITKAINQMTFQEYKTFASKIITVYLKNNGHSEFPNRLIIPSSDYYALGMPYSESNPMPKRVLLEETFRTMLEGDFKILPLFYANKDELKEYTGDNNQKDRYVLYNYDIDNLRRDIPVDLTLCEMGASPDGYNLNQAMYGQFSAITIRRPDTIMYFEPVA